MQLYFSWNLNHQKYLSYLVCISQALELVESEEYMK